MWVGSSSMEDCVCVCVCAHVHEKPAERDKESWG